MEASRVGRGRGKDWPWPVNAAFTGRDSGENALWTVCCCQCQMSQQNILKWNHSHWALPGSLSSLAPVRGETPSRWGGEDSEIWHSLVKPMLSVLEFLSWWLLFRIMFYILEENCFFIGRWDVVFPILRKVFKAWNNTLVSEDADIRKFCLWCESPQFLSCSLSTSQREQGSQARALKLIFITLGWFLV